MKSLSLKYYKTPNKSSCYIKDKAYTVFLDSGQRHSFTDRTHLTYFLVQVSKTINYYIHELTILSSEVHALAAEAWILIDDLDAKIFRKIAEVMESNQLLFDRQSHVENTSNGVNWAVTQVRVCASMLSEITDQLIMLNKKKKLTLSIRKAEMLKGRLDKIHDDTFDIANNLKE